MIRWKSPVLVFAASLTMAACGASQAEDADGAPEQAVAERKTLEIRAEAAGLIEPIRVVEVKSKASGEVLRLHAQTGDAVARGALLAEIDPRDVRNAFEQAEADLEVARVRRTTADAQRKRADELRQANVVTEQEYEAAVEGAATARASFVRAQTNLQLARERMRDVAIRAPIAGVVIQRTVEEGQIVASATSNISGGTTLMLMADLNEMQVRTLVDETDIGRVQPGQEARVTVEAYPGRPFMGEVLKIEPQAVVEQNVTMFPVLVRLDNREGLLKPGMNAEVQVEIARREDVVTVPNAAVVSMRDAAAAAATLGLDEDEVREQLQAGFGQARQGGSASEAPAASVATPTAEGAARPAAGQSQRAVVRAAAPADPGSRRPAGPQAAAGRPAAQQPSAECTALRQKLQGGDWSSLSDADRAKLADCRQASGRGRPGDAASGAGSESRRADGVAPEERRAATGGSVPAAGASGQRGGFGAMGGNSGAAGGRSGFGRRSGSGMRPGVVFVVGSEGIEPRTVMLGMNDWESTEIVRGLEPGERVVLISVARMQAQRDEFANRMRSGGPIPGMRAPGGGGAARGGR